MTKRFVFSSSQKMITDEYRVAFSDGRRYHSNYFTLLVDVKKQSEQNAKVGLVVAKKNFKKATLRIQLKRMIRESFRLHQELLGGLNIIVIVNKKASSVINDGKGGEVRKHLDQQWINCLKWLKRPSCI